MRSVSFVRWVGRRAGRRRSARRSSARASRQSSIRACAAGAGGTLRRQRRARRPCAAGGPAARARRPIRDAPRRSSTNTVTGLPYSATSRATGVALAALVALDPVVDAERGELLDPRLAAFVLQIGEDDDVRASRRAAPAPRARAAPASGGASRPGRTRRASPTSPRASAAGRRRGASSRSRNRRAGARNRCRGARRARRRNADHVQQHFVAIADQQRAFIDFELRARGDQRLGLRRRARRRRRSDRARALRESRAPRRAPPDRRPRARRSAGVRPVSVEQPRRARRLGQRPDQRAQRERFGVVVCIARRALPIVPS